MHSPEQTPKNYSNILEINRAVHSMDAQKAFYKMRVTKENPEW